MPPLGLMQVLAMVMPSPQSQSLSKNFWRPTSSSKVKGTFREEVPVAYLLAVHMAYSSPSAGRKPSDA